MKVIKKVAIVVCILVITNFPPINYLIHGFEVVDLQHYSYSNSDDPSTIFHEQFGSPFTFRTSLSKDYQISHPNNDTVLYRNFWKNPFCFWRWREYMTEKKYNLPYISIKDVKKNADRKIVK